MSTPSNPIIGASGRFRLGLHRLDVNGVVMRVLTTVWAALLASTLAVMWGSPVALAQSDGRDPYGPVAATRAKPAATSKPATQATAAKPATQATAAKPATQATAAKPRQPAPATTASRTEAAMPTDGKA